MPTCDKQTFGPVCTGCNFAYDYGTPGPYWQCANCIRNKAWSVPQDFFTEKKGNEKKKKAQPSTANGTLYRTCADWGVSAGRGRVCHDTCSSEQRTACKSQYALDKTEEGV